MSQTYSITVVKSLALNSGSWEERIGGITQGTTDADVILGLNNQSDGAYTFPVGTPFAYTHYAEGVGGSLNNSLWCDFDLTSNIISLNGQPNISFAGLPAGFTPTTAELFIGYTPSVVGFLYTAINLQLGPQNAPVTTQYYTNESGSNLPAGTGPLTASYVTAPSTLDLFLNGFGFQINWDLYLPGHTSTGSLAIWEVNLSGTYSLATYTWYFNPTTNHFAYLTINPGAPWIAEIPTPALSITNLSPTIGCPAGGTPFTLTGTGFGDGAIVLFGSALATNVIVVNANTIIGTNPPGSGSTTVTVYNPDNSTATF